MYNAGDTNLGQTWGEVAAKITQQLPEGYAGTTTKIAAPTVATAQSPGFAELLNTGFGLYNKVKILEYEKKARKRAEALAQAVMSAQLAEAAAIKRAAIMKSQPLTAGEVRRAPATQLFGMDMTTVALVGGAAVLGLFAMTMIPKKAR